MYEYFLEIQITSCLDLEQDLEHSKVAVAPKTGTGAAAAAAESKETDIERKKREADELLKGIMPDDVIDGSAGYLNILVVSKRVKEWGFFLTILSIARNSA